jgi:DNA adenine methylase
MVKDILPLIPAHKQYVEPFLGGGAIFFAKQPSFHEVINDLNGLVTNFYWVLKENAFELEKKIKSTAHSEVLWRQSKEICKNPSTYDKVTIAWAFWVQCNMSFAGNPYGGFAFDNVGKNSKCTANKRKEFNAERFAKRLEKVEIFQRDALEIIKLKDTKDTFFYLDPPYMNADQGFYSGYMENDYRNLLETISCIKGKFLLSNYVSEILDEYIKRNNWSIIKLEKKLTASPFKRTDNKRKLKIECLIYNYKTPQKRLFY